MLKTRNPIELEKLDKILCLDGLFSKNYFDKMNLLEYIIENGRGNPILLLNTLRIVFKHSEKLQLSCNKKTRNIFMTFAIFSNQFADQQFVEGWNLLFEETKKLDPTLNPATLLCNSMVLNAALRNDVRLLIFLTEIHKLDIAYCDSNGQNAYFYTSSAATIEYLYKQGVDVHIILSDMSTPITHLLDKVLLTDSTRNDHIVCECVALYYSYGVQSVVDMLKADPRTRTYDFEEFHNQPLRLAKQIMEKYGSYHNLLAMIQGMNVNHVLPTWAYEVFLTKTRK
jgi:hypothetical protein